MKAKYLNHDFDLFSIAIDHKNLPLTSLRYDQKRLLTRNAFAAHDSFYLLVGSQKKFCPNRKLASRLAVRCHHQDSRAIAAVVLRLVAYQSDFLWQNTVVLQDDTYDTIFAILSRGRSVLG